METVQRLEDNVDIKSKPDSQTQSDTAKVFMSGNSQAVRLPKAYRFDADIDTLEIKKVGDSIVLTPKQTQVSVWDEFVQGLAGFDSDFADCFKDREKENRLADMAEVEKNAALSQLFLDSPDK
ncbi:antitoxin [Psychrobacter arenosus]|uniref:antitoxin n=1 Tax=Psychrobacter arenosus TaxID=256326 RepID=UPI00191859BC|nr:type II toxin-antitoxin system VapB family antitoxin [Psychrobacter arenosus]